MIRGHGAQNTGVNRLESTGGLYNGTGEDLRVTANRRQEGEVTPAGRQDDGFIFMDENSLFRIGLVDFVLLTV